MTDQEPPPVQPQYARFDSRSGGYENTDRLRQRNGSNTGATSASAGVKSSLSSSSTSNNKMDELRPIIISTLMLIFGSIAWIYLTPISVGRRGIGGEGIDDGRNLIRRVRGRFYEDPYHHSGRRMQDTRVIASVPLSSLYSGFEVFNISFSRREVCSHCHGAGGLGMKTCDVCGGQGAEIFSMQVAPGHYQRMQRSCHRCGGQGRVAEKACPHCHGEGMAQRHINLPILLSSGLQNGDVIRLPYQGDQHTQVGAGDILVEIVEERVRSPNSRLLTASRPLSNERSDDLEVECSISLKEALLGFSREFFHPGSKKIIQYSSPSGKVSIPGEIYRILGQGMPRRSTNSMEYQLIVPSDKGGEGGGGNGGNGREKIIEMQKKDGLEDRRLKEVQASEHRQYGDLRVRVKVKLPEKISIEERKVIEDYL